MSKSKVESYGGVRKGSKANIALLALRVGQQSSEELNGRSYGLSHEMPGLKKLGLVVDVVSGRGKACRSVWELTEAGVDLVKPGGPLCYRNQERDGLPASGLSDRNFCGAFAW